MTESKSPQWHYDEAERLSRATRRHYNGGQKVRDELPSDRNIAAAQVHATLALAGFTRDAATGADHVHDLLDPQHDPFDSRDAAVVGTTEPGRPA